jgi:chromosome partitioning protein
VGRILAVANQKGGVGKTTTAINVGACLARMGERVLLIDADPQCNATSGLGIDRRQVGRSLYDVLIDGAPIGGASQETAVPGLWVVPSSWDLADGEALLVNAARREFRLREALGAAPADFAFVLIDCPPSLGLLTINALVAADGVLVPIQCEYYALEGVVRVMDAVQRVRAHLNPRLEIDGVLMTMFDGRTNLSIQVVDEVKRKLRGKVHIYRALVPRNVRLSEAPSHGLPIVLYDGRSRGAEVYAEVAKEVMERAHGQTGPRTRP